MDQLKKKEGEEEEDGGRNGKSNPAELLSSVHFGLVSLAEAKVRPLLRGRTSSPAIGDEAAKGKRRELSTVVRRGGQEVGGKRRNGRKIEKSNRPSRDWATAVNLDRRWPRNTIFWRIELLIAKILRQKSPRERGYVCASAPDYFARLE